MTIAAAFLLAWLTTPSLRTCDAYEPLWVEGRAACQCPAPIYVDDKGIFRCAGLCPEGFEATMSAPDRQPVCIRKETIEDRLQRMEQKLDTLLQQKEGRP